MYIQIDEDILYSLYGFYFGDVSDKYKAATYRAYRDFNRTIDFNLQYRLHIPKLDDLSKENKKKEIDKRIQLKNDTAGVFKQKIEELRQKESINQVEFDEWHNNVCNEIIAKYRTEHIILAYGQAQKWLNMTIKYLYCLQEYDFKNEEKFLHIPIDKHIIDLAYTEFGIRKNKKAWSSWDYDTYKGYQNLLKEEIKIKTAETAFKWEFHNWLTAAKSKEITED